ncbi:MAG TPA: YcjX family protein [Stellaceae bacterium]
MIPFPETTVRLAVTGLSGAGKTVFITSLVHNLLAAGVDPRALPLMRLAARRQLAAAKVDTRAEPSQRHFPYAELMQSFAAVPPRWPPSTTGTSRIRVAIRYRPANLAVRRAAGGLATLNLDLIDYPGEWLLDLPMLRQDFAAWSRATLTLAETPPRAALAAAWRGFLAAHPPDAPADEATARTAADLYRDYLLACRGEGLSLLQPGRLVAPGEHEGAPMLSFCPLPVAEGKNGKGPKRGSLHALMAERFDTYRRHVVERFYREHFRRFDRQVVLVDVLHALNRGPAAFEDARLALAGVLESFRVGKTGWLASLLGAGRIDKVLFVATKADHVTPRQYANLRQLLEKMTVGSALDLRFRGAAVSFTIVASVRCTEPGIGTFEGQRVGMLSGIPVGATEPAILFPGEVPADVPAPEHWTVAAPDFPVFRPPRLSPTPGTGAPHLGLDEALEFLIGDKTW